jgi:hypothetical protein
LSGAGSAPITGPLRSNGERRITRVLVAIAPRSYREAVALYIHRHRPTAEVLIAPPGDLDREVGRFKPHVAVCNEVTENVRESVASWVEILFEDSMDANVSVDELRSQRIEDIGMDDLLKVLDETEGLLRTSQS